MTETIPDLDPGGKKALDHLNALYAMEYKNWDELSRDDLIYYLRQVLYEYGLAAGSYKHLTQTAIREIIAEAYG